MILALPLLLVLLAAAPAGAADYWVKNGGSDAADGLSVATAWATLGHAADLVDPGDTVHVMDGSYQGFYLERSGALLRLAQRGRLVGVHAVDAGLAATRQQVGDPLALRGPAGDGGRGPVLDVIGVRGDGEGPLPVLRQRRQKISHGPKLAGRRADRWYPVSRVTIRE